MSSIEILRGTFQDIGDVYANAYNKKECEEIIDMLPDKYIDYVLEQFNDEFGTELKDFESIWNYCLTKNCFDKYLSILKSYLCPICDGESKDVEIPKGEGYITYLNQCECINGIRRL